MSEQIAVRIPDQLARELDLAVASGGYSSRAEAVRLAITSLVDTERRRRVGAAIAEGYRRQPQSDEDVAVAERLAIASIEDEPW